MSAAVKVFHLRTRRPSGAMKYVSGTPRIPYWIEIGPALPEPFAYVMPYLLMKAWASASTSCTLTPTNVTCPSVRRAASCRTAASSAHGPHHDAQKLTTTGLPLLSASERVKLEPSN